MSYIQQFFTSRDNNANAETFVGQEGRLWWDPVTNQIYSSDGNTPGGIPLSGGGGGNGTPGGTNGQVQFNQAGNFGGSANLTFVSATGTLTAVSFVGNGAALTNITGSNVVGTVADATHAGVADTATSATTAATVTTADQPNISSVGTLTSLSSTGNISGNYFIGNGSLLTGIATSYGNANVSAYLASGTNSANIITTANARSGNLSVTGSIQLGGLITATGNITGGNLLTGANVSATSNITGGNLISNGLITTLGNVVANYFVGNGSALFAIAGANVSGAVANATYATSAGSATTATSATTAGTVTTNAQPNITSVGTLTSVNSTGNISTTGNVIAGNIIGTHVGNLTGTTASLSGNVTGGNVLTGGLISSTGNIDGGNLRTTGVVSALGGIISSGEIYSATAVTGGAVSGATVFATGNVTGGNILTGGLISATGNISGGNIIGTHVGNIIGTTASLSGNVTGGNILTGGLISATGNITVGNITTTIANFTTFNSSIGGNVTGTLVATSANAQFINQTNAAGYATVAGYLSVVGNVTGGNILTGGLISATGNITSAANISGANLLATSTLFSASDVIIGNIANTTAQKLRLVSTGTDTYIQSGNGVSNSTGNVTFASWLQTGTRLVMDITNSAFVAAGNITGGNILTGNVVSATGNIIAGNISTGGLITATGNITATANITGGNLLTAGISSATGNATFGNISTVGLITATGNITVGNVNTGGRMSATGNILGGNLTVTGFGTVTYAPASTTGYALQLNAANTVGGAGYGDFLRATNTSGGATNPNKSFRVNNIGTLEILNSAYTAVALSVSDSGQLALAAAATANNDPTSNWLSFNNNNAAIYDDGNFHIHARGNGSNMWINAGNAAIIIGNQATTSGGSPATGVIMGSSSSIKAYLSVYGSKTYAIGTYGYLATSGAGTGASTTASYSIYSDNRMNASEFDATSDERAKDIQGTIPLDQALKFVRVVDGLLYTWNGLAVDSDPGLKAGFSAQRVHKAGFDHMIGVVENEKMKEQVDEDGWVHPEGYQLTMGYNQAVPYHHEVIKHLLDRVEQLEATVAKLTK